MPVPSCFEGGLPDAVWERGGEEREPALFFLARKERAWIGGLVPFKLFSEARVLEGKEKIVLVWVKGNLAFHRVPPH